MDKVCVNCGNKNPVNITDNRLVTESCGHVKCIQCLVQEKSGCVACKKSEEKSTDSLPPEDVVDVVSDHETVETEMPMLLQEVTKESQNTANEDQQPSKHKLDTSHIKVVDDGYTKRYKCTACKKKFNARSQVTYHAYCNGQPKPYQCPHAECGNKSFATQSHYKYHMQVHNKERAYSCEVCGDRFYQMSKLQRHKLKHTNKKEHDCAVCHKAFNNMSSLRKHMRLHTDERPYKCEQCGFRFRDSSNYQKHLVVCPQRDCKVRTRVRRAHLCPVCPQSFLTRKDMRRHAHVHSDVKPYVCKLCKPERWFRRKDNLERHHRNTHPDAAPAPCAPAAIPALATATPAHVQNGTTEADSPKKTEEACDKAQLKVLNPLPPLTDDDIKKHLNMEEKSPEPVLDKSFIIEANTARESVIVGKCLQRKIPSPVTEYVHKIRKANSMSQKEVKLGPIDETKFLTLFETKNHLKKLDVGPLPKNIQPYKNILREESDAQNEDEKVTEVHWRKKRLTDNE